MHNDIWRKSWKVALAPSNYPHGCQLAVLFTKQSTRFRISLLSPIFSTKEALKYYFAVKKQFDKPTKDIEYVEYNIVMQWHFAPACD